MLQGYATLSCPCREDYDESTSSTTKSAISNPSSSRDMMKGKTPEKIRKTFNIKNDFTPEEEEEIRRENQWAFE